MHSTGEKYLRASLLESQPLYNGSPAFDNFQVRVPRTYAVISPVTLKLIYKNWRVSKLVNDRCDTLINATIVLL